MTSDEVQGIREDIQELALQVKGLQTLIETESARCPYRETIARAQNNRERLVAVEQDQDKLWAANARVRVKLAQAGIGGGAVGMITTMGLVATKIANWW